jgi:hypothetical protein
MATAVISASPNHSVMRSNPSDRIRHSGGDADAEPTCSLIGDARRGYNMDGEAPATGNEHDGRDMGKR